MSELYFYITLLAFPFVQLPLPRSSAVSFHYVCVYATVCVCAHVRCPIASDIIMLFLLSVTRALANHVVNTRQSRP